MDDIIDYNLDGIDPITVAMDVYVIIDYNLDAIHPITVAMELTQSIAICFGWLLHWATHVVTITSIAVIVFVPGCFV